MKRGLLTALASTALACSGAGPQVQPRTAPGMALDQDERGIWRLAGEAERRLASSGRLVEAPELDAYLLEVARRLQPAEVLAATRFRIRVLRQPDVNSFTMPTGAIYVTSGLLARLDSEAEIASVLGHEMSHVVQRDGLRELRKEESVPGFLARVELSSYSQEREREADRQSLAAVVRGGYAPEAVRTALEKGKAAQAEEEQQGARRDKAQLQTHPSMQERIDLVATATAALPSSAGELGVERFQAHVTSLLLLNARLELARARYPAARAQVERHLRLRPGSAAGQALLGEIARREAAPGWEEQALQAFRRAIELDASQAEGWRGLGLVLQRTGDHPGARRALGRYLELAPTAPDRAHIRSYLDGPDGRVTP